MTKIFQAKWSFVALQLLDLATTLFAFHLGGYEVNPLVARMATIFGPIGGVAVSKALAVIIAWRVQKLLWVANLFYTVLHGDSFLEYCPYRSDDGGTETLAHPQGPDRII